MAAIIAIHPWELRRVKCHINPFCWYWDGDGLGPVYRAGFTTQDAAETWAKKEGFMT